MIVKLVAEWGHGSDTYDFMEVLAAVDHDGKIERWWYSWSFNLMARLSWALQGKKYVDYGNGYTCRNNLLDDLRSQRIRGDVWTSTLDKWQGEEVK